MMTIRSRLARTLYAFAFGGSAACGYSHQNDEIDSAPAEQRGVQVVVGEAFQAGSPPRLYVPSSAVTQREDRSLVFRVRNARADWVYVDVSPAETGLVEVLPDERTGRHPLSAGDTVVVEGQPLLSHATPVEVVAERSPSDSVRPPSPP